VAAAHDVADADATDDVDDEQAAVIRFAWMQQQQQQEQQQPYVAGQHLYTALCAGLLAMLLLASSFQILSRRQRCTT